MAKMGVLIGCCLLLVGTSIRAEIIADSVEDWSFEGIQGENNWFNGYYNLTLDQDDGDGIYQASDFTAFLNDDSGEIYEDGENHWNGNSWRLFRDTDPNTGPWTSINQNGGHPNGLNSAAPPSVDDSMQEEHWSVRRWVSSYEGEGSLIATLAATNTNCGNGTSVHLFQNGVAIGSSLATAGPTPVSEIIGVNLAIGDVIDFALSPVGIDGLGADGCDGSAFNLAVTNEPGPEPPAPAFADSARDWSATGTQGENNWFNGYYNHTDDADGNYQQEDFMPFTNSEGPDGGDVEPDGNHWTGTSWDLDSQGAPGPWTYLGATGTHPNGTNSAPDAEHWTIRRFVASDLAGTTPVELNWKMAKTNLNGDGVTGALFVNGEKVDAVTIAGGDGAGVDRKFYVNANPGDVIDLALTPIGLTSEVDGSDGSSNQLIINTELPDGPLYNPGDTVADSIADFSGEQGQDGWFYGLYDQRLDVEEGDGEYSVDEFEAFLNDGSEFIWDDPETWRESENQWNGNIWDVVDQGVIATGPWTQIGAANGHPAANAQEDPEVHWAIRRWVSDVEGEYSILGMLNNTSANGDGTVGRILLDGEEIWAEVTDGDIVDVDLTVALSEGSILDFVIDSDGAGNFDSDDPFTIADVNDGSDGTTFSVTIGQRFLFTPGGTQGDYNGNGLLDAGDLDLQTSEGIANQDLRYDENKDGVVNVADRVLWVNDLKNTWMGDADLNGAFDSSDLVAVFAAAKYETGEAASWAQGDWDGNSTFSSSDLVAAFSNAGYDAGIRPGGPNPATAAVPEPSSLVLAVISLFGIAGALRRRNK
ncbi:MAG: PEP-CTERM sorting domain-containing protein [Pirellulaceae bacterium]|nr:PEP-CTERM sorting domain-containing protein [Pirellulaceae bacterium]